MSSVKSLCRIKTNGLRDQHLPQNIIMILNVRELWGEYQRPGTAKYLERSMYRSIYPNFTALQVVKPPCFIRKFTPDGKHFIAFSSDQISIEVYYFMGPQSANHLFATMGAQWLDAIKITHSVTQQNGLATLGNQRANDYGLSDPHARGIPDHVMLQDNDTTGQEISRNLFNTFFKIKFRITVAPIEEKLNTTCSLFTEDYKYMIVGSSKYSSGVMDAQSSEHYFDIYRNNESADINPESPLCDYSIHLVDIQHGVLSDTLTFKTDKIFLSHSHGMYLYKNKLAILSVQHQTIHLFHVDGGRFLKLQTIGRFCHDDDELIVSQVAQNIYTHPNEEAFLNSLKHRLLTHVFKKGYTDAYEANESDMSTLNRFYQYYERLKKSRIMKMQLLDKDHLLLKYSNTDVVTPEFSKLVSQHCLFVFYNIPKTQVLAVYENTSECLLELYDSFVDDFRNSFLTLEARCLSSPSNNFYSKEACLKIRTSVFNARYGGITTEARKRILHQLPISAQCICTSPYLDQSLFSYDGLRISTLETRMLCGLDPIRFAERDSKLFKFRLHTGRFLDDIVPSNRIFVEFTFHPSAPFAISLQQAANNESCIHFHFRLDPLSVMPL